MHHFIRHAGDALALAYEAAHMPEPEARRARRAAADALERFGGWETTVAGLRQLAAD